MQYNDFGQLKSDLYYEENDKLVINTEYDCAGFIYKYDDHGNEELLQYVGTDEKLRFRTDIEAAQRKTEYDDASNVIKQIYMDISGNPVERNN